MLLYLHRQVAQLFFFTCQTRGARSQIGVCMGSSLACVCVSGWCVLEGGGSSALLHTQLMQHAFYCGNMPVCEAIFQRHMLVSILLMLLRTKTNPSLD